MTNTNLTTNIFILISSYLIGSINFSIIILKHTKKQDPRSYGSQNAGATNVYRQTGILIASIVLFLDITRAWLVGIIAIKLKLYQLISWICLGLIIGNCYPCFHKFKGGKGIANYLGFITAISPIYGFTGTLTWTIFYIFFQIPFISSLTMVLILTIEKIIILDDNYTNYTLTALTLLLIIFRHKYNILKLYNKKFKTNKKNIIN